MADAILPSRTYDHVASHGDEPVGKLHESQAQTLADLNRDFNALFETSVAYKPFHNQLAKRQFADFMRKLACKLIERWAVQAG